MTLNLANYTDHKDWPRRLDAIAAVILDKQPDIIALQEVRFDPEYDSRDIHASTKRLYQNMGEQLLGKITQTRYYSGSAIVSQPGMFYDSMRQSDEAKFRHYPQPKLKRSRKELWEGLSTISRLPVIETGSRFLHLAPGAKDRNRRVTQYTAVQTAHSPLYIFNCHFGYDPESFASNLRETADYLDRFADSLCLLVGDLNFPPQPERFEALTRKGYFDLWEFLHPDDEGRTSPSHNPTERIDYMWANSHIEKTRAHKIELVATEPYTTRKYPSDHFGLIAELSL
jgi:endonuclease/exonuclease/phosphatase family metal-dependent hydrolase